MKKLLLAAAVATLAVASAHADEAGRQYCGNMFVNSYLQERALLSADPEKAHKLRWGSYELTIEEAARENIPAKDVFYRCMHSKMSNNRGISDSAWASIKHEMTTNVCGNDNQQFVYGHGCVSSDAAAIIEELHNR